VLLLAGIVIASQEEARRAAPAIRPAGSGQG